MEKQPEKKNNLTPEEIEEFKTILLEKRSKLLGTVSYMENDALRVERTDLSSMPVHMADLGTDSFEQEFTLELMDSERKIIVEINDALSRIENGTYGICEIGGEPITKQRLEAIPWARCCIACASLLEKGLIKREDSINRFHYANGVDEDQENDLDSPETAD
jgi:RNA polymerase-binding protein DksA